MNWQPVYDAYPVNANTTWLNNCGITPTGSHIARRMAEHFARLVNYGPGAGDASPDDLLRSLRERLGALIHAQPEDIAPIHNTAEGMTMISLGLDLGPGDQILLLENEYPSNVYPWEHWRDRGVDLAFVPAGRTPAEFFDNFQRALTPRTRVAALSMVHWCTGMPLPIADVARTCHQRGVLPVIDGSQGVGMMPLDFDSVAPAALCFSAWKWLLGPLGLGLIVIDRETLSRLRMPFKGTDSVADPSSYLPYQTAMRSTIDRYCYSTANYNDWVYLDESLAFLTSIGFEKIQPRILELTGRLWSGLANQGFVSAYDHGPSPQSGILSVRKPGIDIDHLSANLNQRGFVTRVRLNHLRLAPHIYQSPDQMAATVAAIAEIVGGQTSSS